ncbi:flagellar basal body rod protein FlgC [Demequina sp. TTPB684]|uniref:flagellar basal body rod protein FlgC n=1 Tax=unclassified Demequina TaxID=2620311 RepID=UPI001CF0FD6E|nr:MULTISPECIES: flagellar basal body rod protein FlgC [unclassified Demequina]MCB2411970.1 flagellar basal body rod protein FlgC [Demequina sp. TTPB684]UPU87898.1 flagellar basal body rod protein FlgC [Demequina sp. TMPB413]
MGTFAALGIAGSGMNVYRHWLDAVSDNLANLNTVRPTDEAAFQARYVVAQANDTQGGDSGGVHVAGAAFGDAAGRLVYEPGHPLADEEGYVRYPDIDMSSQMVQLIMAQRGYQANASVVERAREMYTTALQIGRS